MRAAVVALIGVLTSPAAMKAQAPVGTEEFAVAGFMFALSIPNHSVANGDGTPMISGPGFWLAIKNTTAIPYSLCNFGSSSSISSSTGIGSGIGGATSGCSPYWLLLPGETHFVAVGFASIPKEPDARLAVTVFLEGKPLGAPGDLRQWNLKWTGTVREASEA